MQHKFKPRPVGNKEKPESQRRGFAFLRNISTSLGQLNTYSDWCWKRGHHRHIVQAPTRTSGSFLLDRVSCLKLIVLQGSLRASSWFQSKRGYLFLEMHTTQFISMVFLFWCSLAHSAITEQLLRISNIFFSTHSFGSRTTSRSSWSAPTFLKRLLAPWPGTSWKQRDAKSNCYERKTMCFPVGQRPKVFSTKNFLHFRWSKTFSSGRRASVRKLQSARVFTRSRCLASKACTFLNFSWRSLERKLKNTNTRVTSKNPKTQQVLHDMVFSHACHWVFIYPASPVSEPLRFLDSCEEEEGAHSLSNLRQNVKRLLMPLFEHLLIYFHVSCQNLTLLEH